MRLDMGGVGVCPRLAALVATLLLLLLPLVSAADTKTAVACQALVGDKPNFCCLDELKMIDAADAVPLAGNLAGFAPATHELADEPKTIKCYESDAADATKVDATDKTVVKDKIGQCEAKMTMTKGADGAYATVFAFGEATSKDCQAVALDTGKPDPASFATLTSSLGNALVCQFAVAASDPNTHTYTCTCVPQGSTPCMSPEDLVRNLKQHGTTGSPTDKAVIDSVLDPDTDVKLTVDGAVMTIIAAAPKFKCTVNADKPNFCCLDDLKSSRSALAATPFADADGTPFSTLTKVEDNAASVNCYDAALAELSSLNIAKTPANKEAKKYMKCTLEIKLKADTTGKHGIEKLAFGHEVADCDDSSATFSDTVDALQKEWTVDAGISARCSYDDASKKLKCSCVNADLSKPCNDPKQLRKILKHAAEQSTSSTNLKNYITQVLDVKTGAEVKAKVDGADSTLIKEEKYTCKTSSFCCSADMFEKDFYKANNHLTAPPTTLSLDVYKTGWNEAVTDQAKKVSCYVASAQNIQDLNIIKKQSTGKISERKYASCTITLKFEEQTGDANTKDYIVSGIAFGQGEDAECKKPILPSDSEMTCTATSDLELVCSCVNEQVDKPCNDPKKIRAAVVLALASDSLSDKLLKGANSLVSGGKTFAVKVEGAAATLFESEQIYKKMGLETGRAAGNIHPLRRAMQPKNIVNKYTLNPGTYMQFRTTTCAVEIKNKDCHRAYACVHTSETGEWKSLCPEDNTQILLPSTQSTPITVNANQHLVVLSVGPTCQIGVSGDCLEEKHAWLRFDTNGNTDMALYPKWPLFDNSPLHAETKSLIALSTGGKVNFDGRATGADHIRNPAKNVECAKGCKDARRIYSYIDTTSPSSKFYIKYTIKPSCEWMYVCFKTREDTMKLERGTTVEARKLSECAKGHSMEIMFKQKLIIMPGHDSAMRFDALDSLDTEIRIDYKGHYEVTSLTRDVFATSERKGYLRKTHGKGIYTITSRKECISKYSTAYSSGSSWYNALSVMNGDEAPGTEDSIPDPDVADSFNSLNPSTDLRIQDEDEDTGDVQGADDGEYVTQAAPTEPPTVMVVVNKETEAPKIDRSQDGTDNRNSMTADDALLLWGAFIGFCMGMLLGLIVASFLFYVCRRSFYKDWYRSMYSRYGSSATTASPTETGAGGTVAGLAGNSTMGGTSMMGSTMGGTTSGGTTAGGDSTMGGTTAT